jgi:hypothetical protein
MSRKRGICTNRRVLCGMLVLLPVRMVERTSLSAVNIDVVVDPSLFYACTLLLVS